MKDLLSKALKFSFLMILLFGVTACHLHQPSENEIRKSEIGAGYNVELGVGYLQQGNIPRAKAKLLLALKQAPDWPPALDAMGYFLEKTGDADQALVYYQRSLAVAPHDGKVLNNYGTFLCRQKKYVQAEHYFLAAVKDPNYLTTAEAYENAGLCALNIPDDKKAEAYFKKALLQEPQRVSLMFELAKLAYRQQQYAAAKQYIDSYLNLAAANPAVLLLGYQTAKKRGDTASAMRYAALLRTQFPAAPEAQQL